MTAAERRALKLLVDRGRRDYIARDNERLRLDGDLDGPALSCEEQAALEARRREWRMYRRASRARARRRAETARNGLVAA